MQAPSLFLLYGGPPQERGRKQLQQPQALDGRQEQEQPEELPQPQVQPEPSLLPPELSTRRT